MVSLDLDQDRTIFLTAPGGNAGFLHGEHLCPPASFQGRTVDQAQPRAKASEDKMLEIILLGRGANELRQICTVHFKRLAVVRFSFDV